jgi:hypothetical protein
MDVGALCQQVIDAEGRSGPPFGTYVFPASHPGAALGRLVEHEVFLEFFGNSEAMLDEEYRSYAEDSVYVCVIDHRALRPAGVMRVVVPGAAGFKTLHDIDQQWARRSADVLIRAGIDLDPERVWDLATLAVSKPYRGGASAGLIPMAIFQAIGMLATHHNIRWLVAIIDLIVLDLVQPQLHDIWRPIPGLEPRRYLDSTASIPIYCDLPAYRERLEPLDPTLYELLFDGVGLEEAVSPPTWRLGVDGWEGLASTA